MFRSAYQGGDYVEVFSPAGKRPMEHWKLTGKCSRMYDKGVKGYVLAIVGGAGSKMQAPKAPKAMMGLRQRHLVLQVLTASSEDKPFSVELGLTDASGTRRRLVLSSAFRTVHCTPHHAQIPLPGLRQRRGSWANLSVDMWGLVAMCFRDETFNSLDLVAIGPVCRVRKIFTMRGALDRSEGLDVEPGVCRDSGCIDDDKGVPFSAPVEPLPPRMAFPAGVLPPPVNWVISPSTLRAPVGHDPLLISLPSDQTPSAPSSSRAFLSPRRLRPDAPLTTSAVRCTPTLQGEKRSSLSNRSAVSGRGLRGAQSPARACSRSGAPEAALATPPKRKSVIDRPTSSTRSYQDHLPPSRASERSIPLHVLPAQTSRGSITPVCVTGHASAPSPARRPSSPITADLVARGVGVEGTSWHPKTPPGEKEGIVSPAPIVQPTSPKVPGLTGMTTRRRNASEGDVFYGEKNGLPARRRALEIASVSGNNLHAPNRHRVSGRIFTDCYLDYGDSLAAAGSPDVVEPGELAGNGLRGLGQILGGGDSIMARCRTSREDLSQGKGPSSWSLREGSTNDGSPLESDRPRRINSSRKPSCLSMRNKNSNYLAAALQADRTIPGKSRSSTKLSESASAGGEEALPLSRDVGTSHDEARRRRSSACTPPDIFSPRDVDALSQRSDKSMKGDFTSDKRSPGASPFRRISYTTVQPVASGASNNEISSRRGDGFMQAKIFGRDTTSRALPVHFEQHDTPKTSEGAKNTNFSRGGREGGFYSPAALPATGHGLMSETELPSPERVDALQALLASSAFEMDSPMGIMESVSRPGVGGAFEALASRSEGGNYSGVGSSSPGEDDMLEQSSSRNEALERGYKGCRGIRTIDLDNFEIKSIDGRGGMGVVDSVRGDDTGTPFIDGGYGDDRRVVQSPPERPQGNKESGMNLGISPEPQDPWTITVYDRPTGLAGGLDRRELEAKELALFDLEKSYRSEFGSIDSR